MYVATSYKQNRQGTLTHGVCKCSSQPCALPEELHTYATMPIGQHAYIKINSEL